ncbi:hypothetical protein K461DRAFT_288959 [Myriangium duriaei CBS 260.36]|uniref:Rhodopsin domain-containing protein n=1 Tax=Myriangium duriaei CBS 260.36 TaxID=1168546 RepID=A0A9P4MJ06_9PEZI|nr:hypothetical protein K461DRAFT_288959 [Myriangium duriaei CBS 260.36]
MFLLPRDDAPGKGINQVPIQGVGEVILTISFILAGVAVVLLGLRVYASQSGASRLRADFWFVAVGTALGVATEGLFVMACKNGIGRHISQVSADQLWQALRWSWIGIFTGLVGTFTAKLGIVALLYTVATPTQKKRKAFLLAVGGINIIAGVAQLALSLSQCDPYEKLWYRLLPGTCNHILLASNFGYVQGSIAIAADFGLAVYPVTIVWNLQASLRTKVGFCVLMAGGLLCAIAAIMRTYYISKLINPADPTWDLVSFLAWASTELWFVIIIASIPPLRPLFIRWFGNTISFVTGSNSRSATRSKTGNTKNGTVALQSVHNVKNDITSRVMDTHADGSEENILQPQGKSDQIMVSQAYTVEVDRE